MAVRRRGCRSGWSSASCGTLTTRRTWPSPRSGRRGRARASSVSTSRATSCSYPSLAPYREPYAIAAAAGLGLTAHAAEAGPAAAAVEAVETLGVTRIGHGSHIADDPATLAWAAGAGIAIEVCPTSNVLTGARPVDPRAPAPRVPRGRLPGRPRRRQPDQHRQPDLGRGGATRRRGRPQRRAAPRDPPDGLRRRVHRRIDEAARRAAEALAEPREPSRPRLAPSRRSAATRSPCSDPSRPPAPPPTRSGPPPSSRRRAAATGTAPRRRRPPRRAARRSSESAEHVDDVERPGLGDGLGSVAERRNPQDAALVRVDRHALEALVDEVAEDAERRPPWFDDAPTTAIRRAPAGSARSRRRRRPRPARGSPARSR